jgi:hypothetical protein
MMVRMEMAELSYYRRSTCTGNILVVLSHRFLTEMWKMSGKVILSINFSIRDSDKEIEITVTHFRASDGIIREMGVKAHTSTQEISRF